MDAEIARRQPVWHALSDLYLDTELTENDYSYIAKVLNESGYSLSEIKEIDKYEVYPVVGINMYSVAGEWAGFDKEWLYECCEEYYRKTRRNILLRKFYDFSKIVNGWMTRDSFKELEKRIDKK